MGRQARVFRRKASGGDWYGTVNGARRKIADADVSEREAEKLFTLRCAGIEESDSPQVGAVLAQFLEHAKGRVARGEMSPDTHRYYWRRLMSFGRACGGVPIDHLRPSHVLAWLDSHGTWGATYRAGCVTSVKVALTWAKRAGLTDANPVADMQRPRPRRSEAIPERAVIDDALRSCASNEFRLFLRVLFETGCRRSEALAVEAKDLDFARSLWHRVGKSTWATGKSRVVHLTPGLLEILREQAKRFPNGPLLRNTRGQPWTVNSVNCQMRRLKARVALPKFTMRGLRKAFVTDALERGVPVATVAELVGHANTSTIAKHYSHLSERHEHLRDALSRVRAETPQVEPASQSASKRDADATSKVPPQSPATPRKRSRRPRES